MRVSVLHLVCLTACAIRALGLPVFAGLDASLEAAANLCATDTSNSTESGLTMRLQALVDGQVFSCQVSEGRFVDATAALWVSGYAPDQGLKPALVLQPASKRPSLSCPPRSLALVAMHGSKLTTVKVVFGGANVKLLLCLGQVQQMWQLQCNLPRHRT